MRVADMVEDIRQALSNLTGLIVNEDTGMTTGDLEACGGYRVDFESSDDEDTHEESTGSRREHAQNSTSPSSSSEAAETEETTGPQLHSVREFS